MYFNLIMRKENNKVNNIKAQKNYLSFQSKKSILSEIRKIKHKFVKNLIL